MQEVYVNGSEFDSAQEILEYLRDEMEGFMVERLSRHLPKDKIFRW